MPNIALPAACHAAPVALILHSSHYKLLHQSQQRFENDATDSVSKYRDTLLRLLPPLLSALIVDCDITARR